MREPKPRTRHLLTSLLATTLAVFSASALADRGGHGHEKHRDARHAATHHLHRHHQPVIQPRGHRHHHSRLEAAPRHHVIHEYRVYHEHPLHHLRLLIGLHTDNFDLLFHD